MKALPVCFHNLLVIASPLHGFEILSYSHGHKETARGRMAVLPGVWAGSLPPMEGLPALGRAALGFTDAHHSAEQQPHAIFLSPNSLCYINCIIDPLKKLSGLFMPRQLLEGEDI